MFLGRHWTHQLIAMIVLGRNVLIGTDDSLLQWYLWIDPNSCNRAFAIYLYLCFLVASCDFLGYTPENEHVFFAHIQRWRVDMSSSQEGLEGIDLLAQVGVCLPQSSFGVIWCDLNDHPLGAEKCKEWTGPFCCFFSKVVSTHLWNTPLNLYQRAIEGFLS